MTSDNLDLTDNASSFTDLASTPAKLASLDIASINKSALFTKEECATILTSCIEELWMPSTVVGTANLHLSKRQKLRGDVQGFPFLNIREVTKTANDEIYDFNLLGIIDQDFPQLFKYTENSFYNWHIDLNTIAPSRKITFIINLTDTSEYTGGEIEFLNIDTSTANVSEQGTCLIFPSFMPWRVNPVKSGCKNIIVGHVHGALFK